MRKRGEEMAVLRVAGVDDLALRRAARRALAGVGLLELEPHAIVLVHGLEHEHQLGRQRVRELSDAPLDHVDVSPPPSASSTRWRSVCTGSPGTA
jgi:hypothetical protein